jgi:hypothetical protein
LTPEDKAQMDMVEGRPGTAGTSNGHALAAQITMLQTSFDIMKKWVETDLKSLLEHYDESFTAIEARMNKQAARLVEIDAILEKMPK